MSSTQLVVIGAGPGGYAAAFAAADLGMQVALVDTELNPGGVCLYRGCIPSKALLHVAKLIAEAKHASAWGITYPRSEDRSRQAARLQGQRRQKLTGGLGQLSKQRKVNYIQGRASFASNTATDDRPASRAAPRRSTSSTRSSPPARGRRRCPGSSIDSPRLMDSTAALDLPDIPKSLLVVGGGYIGLELGSVYAALGTKVTVVEMTPGLLPGADRDLVTFLSAPARADAPQDSRQRARRRDEGGRRTASR